MTAELRKLKSSFYDRFIGKQTLIIKTEVTV